MKNAFAILTLVSLVACGSESNLGAPCETDCENGLQCLVIADSRRCDIGGPSACASRICTYTADDVPVERYGTEQGQQCGDGGIWLVVRAGEQDASKAVLLCVPTCDLESACPFGLQPYEYNDFGCACLPWWPEA